MPYYRISLFMLALLGLFAFVGCGGGGSNGPANGQIQGHIYFSTTKSITTTDTGSGAGGAQVLLIGTAFKTVADANGSFTLNNVPEGTYTLLVTASGYQSITLVVPVTGGKTVDIASGATPVTRKWTVLVYMNGNNDLEQFGMLNMNQMETAPASGTVSVVVQMARSDQYDTSDGNWNGTRRYLVQHDPDMSAIHSFLLQDMGLVDMGQPTTLHDFIAWGKQTFPAEHYLVVVWDHGSGVLPFTAGHVITRGVSFDSRFGSYIRTIDLGSALTVSPPVDCVAFDTCETQMAEIAYQMRGACKYIIASEGDTPGTGYPYQNWLASLVGNPSMSPQALSTMMASGMADYYRTSTGIEESVIDTAQLDGLASAVDTFAQALIAAVDANAVQLTAARINADHYANSDYRDLLHYATLVKSSVSDPTVDSAADGVINAIHSTLIAEYHGSDHPNVGGISIYLTDPANYVSSATIYSPLDFSQRTHWDEWLAAQKK